MQWYRFLVQCSLCWLINYSLALAMDLPDIGSSAGSVLSPAEERELGENFLRKMRENHLLLDDPVVDAYLDALGYRLVSYSEQPEQTFHFFAVNDSSINAFAVPGGFIGIHSGLILYTRNEDELAAVVAHEIAHVVQHHITRSVETNSKLSIPLLATMIAAAALGANNPEVAQAAITALTAGSIQMQINFTRVHEQEADRVGMEILSRSGFDPAGMPNFFGRMQESSRLYEQVLPELLRTHPVTLERIAESRARCDQLPKQQHDHEEIPYHLARAQVLVATHENPKQLGKILEKNLAEGKFLNENALRYGIVLAGLASHPEARLQTHIDWLFTHDRPRAIYHDLAARLAVALGQVNQALYRLEDALRLYPKDAQLTMRYAEILLTVDQAPKAQQLLEQYANAAYPEQYRLLAKAHQATGESERAKLAMAKFYFYTGHTISAIEQLEQIEQKNDPDYYFQSQVAALLKHWQDILRAEKQEK